MKSLRSTTKTVKHLLETVPETRSNEMLLYYRVYETINKDVLSMPFGYVLLSLNKLRVPKFESIRRSRQKLRAAYPNLAGSDEVEAQRKLNEEMCREYAKEVLP